jgi:hypothetical protein
MKLGNPESSLKTLMAYPHVKLVTSFVMMMILNFYIFCVSLFKIGSTTSIACLGMENTMPSSNKGINILKSMKRQATRELVLDGLRHKKETQKGT